MNFDSMHERPAVLTELDQIFAAATLAHERIAGLYRELSERETALDQGRALLRESAFIATQQMPGAVAKIVRLGRRWEEEALLDPTQAVQTLHLLEATFETARPKLLACRRRQNEIVETLRGLTRSRE